MGLLDFGKDVIKGAAGSIIGAGANLYGGAKQTKLAKDQFRQQMDQSIQRRVADAKKAGVHPLFALGASVGTSPTAHVGDSGIGAAGDALGSGIDRGIRSPAVRREQERQDALTTAQIHASNAAAGRDAAEAALHDANRARIEQGLVARGHDGVSLDQLRRYADGHVSHNPEAFGPVEYVKPEIPLNQPEDPGNAAGVGPFWVERYDTGGRTITVPAEEANADFLASIGSLWQGAQNRVSQWYDRRTGRQRVQGKDGRYRNYKPARSNRRRGKRLTRRGYR